ncbi:MAG: elongation factor 1-beta [Methanomassiliicoccales archaeon]|nr:elongation factor 1-beta [Methanomassiliicoccales archaeon]NYT15086.1 elongation factor 1-beta [Methanomassiliicoccales archaeon]
MGKVAAAYNLMPEDPEYPIENITDALPKAVPEGVNLSGLEVKPLAFGLKVIEVTFIMDDAEGIIDRLEEALSDVPGVQNVETLSLTLI